MAPPVVLYHSADHDGAASAAIVRHAYPDVRMIGVDYGEPFPWDKLNPGDLIFMCDFCLEPVEKMIHFCKRFDPIWIDHHQSSLKMMAKTGLEPKGLRMIGKSGCELTWMFLFPDTPMPRAIHLLGRFDVWNRSDPEVDAFEFGMLNRNTAPENDDLWKPLINNNELVINSILHEGKIIFSYQMKQYAKYASPCVFEGTISGHKALIVNLGDCGSLVFDSVFDPAKYDCMLAFVVKRDLHISVGMYSMQPETNVGDIARRYGGGGHAGAGGFGVKNFETFMKIVKPTSMEENSQCISGS